jgi:alpha-beta hydrolase superfamily lysophospholipase
MTFRIERSASGHAVVLALSGEIAEDCRSQLEALIAADIDRCVIVDLRDIALVDRTGVLLLEACEAAGVALANCPAYVREWIEREREVGARRSSRSKESPMAHAVATTEEAKIDGVGGLQLFFRAWRPAQSVRGIVAVVPGFNSHSGYYAWVGEQLSAVGLATYAVDLRGRGQSDGERFYVQQFGEYVGDVSALVALAKSRHAGLPVFLLGHSAGGVVSCLYTLDHQSELAGLICESFAYQVPAPDFALAVFKGLSHVAPHAHVLHLKNEDFSRDPQLVARMNADPLIAHETQPTQTLAEMVRADERLKASFPRLTLPVLILHGTADKATRPAGSQFFYDTAGSTDKTLKLYDGSFHDPLNDLDRNAVISDIKKWIDTRLPPR